MASFSRERVDLTKDDAAAIAELRKLTFGGKEGIRIAHEANAISDPADMRVEPLARTAVSLFLPSDTPVSTLRWYAGNVKVIGLGVQTAATPLNVESATVARILSSQVLVYIQSTGTPIMLCLGMIACVSRICSK